MASTGPMFRASENEKVNIPYKEFEVAIKKLPLNKLDKLLQYDLKLIELKATDKRVLIFSLSLIFGSITGIVIVLFRDGYRQFKARSAA